MGYFGCRTCGRQRVLDTEIGVSTFSFGDDLKSLIYETPVETEEDLVVRILTELETF